MKSTLVILFSMMISIAYAGFHCPDDVTITCDMDIHNTDMTGYPNTTGINVQYPIKYIDTNTTNGCSVGLVLRSWYQDLNGNNAIDAFEPTCNQRITVDYLDYPLFQINYPSNKNLNCIDDIEFEAPQIVHGPCDLVGWVYEDQIFKLTNDACYKILRTFTVINWCLYDENNPNSEGIETYTQVIKVVEKELPEITSCSDITIPLDQNCVAEVTITATASDVGDCPSEELYWTVSVDIGWDLVTDYEYSYYLTGDRFLGATDNGEALSITLPDLIPAGTHGATYTVRDGCGNVRSCSQKIFVVDQKPPTPYCHSFLTAAFNADAMPAMVPARLFDIGATDNCSDSSKLKFSFSPDVTDSIKVITCSNQGFQFFRIYVTDEAGNQDYCQTFMLIFDNDGCSFRYSPIGRVTDPQGNPLSEVNLEMKDGNDVMYAAMSTQEGTFEFEPTALMPNYTLSARLDDDYDYSPSILDLKHLQDYMLGKSTFTANYQYVAADINRDRKINSLDLIELKDHLLGKKELAPSAFMTYCEQESILEDWKSYIQEIPYLDYDGSFDLTRISISDIHASEDEGKSISINQHVSVKESNNHAAWTTDSSIAADGIEFSLVLNNNLNVDELILSSDYFVINDASIHFNEATGILKMVLLDQILVPEHGTIMNINSKSSIIDPSQAIFSFIEHNTLTTSKLQETVFDENGIESLTSKNILQSNLVYHKLSLKKGVNSGILKIYDLTGNLVYTINPTSFDFDVSELHSGIYVIIWENEGEQRTEKFVKL